MPFKKEYGNIFDYKGIDAIVMPANPKPIIGHGLDAEIYKRAGSELKEARKRIGEIPIGEARMTDAYKLRKNGGPCYIIHAVTPSYPKNPACADEVKTTNELLAECYINSLNILVKRNKRSIVFPLLGAGVLGYPEDTAENIAESACKRFFADTGYDIDITLVKYEELQSKDRPTIDEIQNAERYAEENCYASVNEETRKMYEILAQDPIQSEAREMLEITKKQLERKKQDELIIQAHKERSEYFNHLKDQTCETYFERLKEKYHYKKDVDVAKASNLNPDSVFKIKSEDYKTNREHINALIVGIRGDLNERDDLLFLNNLAVYVNYSAKEAKEEERERYIEHAIKEKWGSQKTNSFLECKGYKTLGSQLRKISD